jgi:hypothetical protein
MNSIGSTAERRGKAAKASPKAGFVRALLGLLLSASAAALGAAEVYIGIPTDGTHRIDICLHWGMECAGEAADVYCKSTGYDGAIEWEVDNDIGATHPTVVIGDGKICADAYCDGYFSITCVREDEWTKSTGNGGLFVEVVLSGSIESAQGLMLIAVAELDERTATAAVVDQDNVALLHTPPGKYRVFAQNWKNPQLVRTVPGLAVDVQPGQEGGYAALTVD